MSSYPGNDAPWLDPRFAQESKFHRWEAPGDTIIGVLRAWSEDEFPEADGKPARPYPVMHLDTANGEKELGLTLADLKAQVFAAQPRIGDTVMAKYLRDGKPKLFHVEVTRAVPVAAPADLPADPYAGVRIDTAPVGYRPQQPVQVPVQDEAPF